ncbi:MAG: dTDP-4-amino-4,6-dideoxygalactose transaminase [Chryseotalea sp.]|jgi:dTDP-4-amino-4,6-dideoxygalactose transaminase|nr:dTDP-4-amino-4,6-dideoxygalactose transaminase [Flammeovirgaceae bacterium]
MLSKIPFNKPFIIGNEVEYIKDAISRGQISGNGFYTKKCHAFFESYFNAKCLLTSSCTDALEMSALLLDIEPGDEVIIPSFTFVSTANAFILRGAKIIFADSQTQHPNIDHTKLEKLITHKTKAIVVVHYAGVACDMDAICDIAHRHNIFVVEDAAQAIDSFYKGKRLGTFGDLAALSFHETKNIIAGEGGLLVINNKSFEKRAEIIWEKGTNRAAFFKGEVNKYGWVDVGSSFLPSDITAAFLFAQLEHMQRIQFQRKKLWNLYFDALKEISNEVGLPYIPEYATNNAHLFYLNCKSETERDNLIRFLKERNIQAVFHYLPLHQSDYIKNLYDSKELFQAQRFSATLIRLPLYFDMLVDDIMEIVKAVKEFYYSNQ